MDFTPLKELGRPYPDHVLLLIEGARRHGAKLEGTDDADCCVSTSSLLRLRSVWRSVNELFIRPQVERRKLLRT